MDELTNYGLLRNLLNARQMTPEDEGHPTSPRESIATEQDALRSLIWIGGYIDRFHTDGALDAETTERLSALLLIARDYILPIPEQRDIAEPDAELAGPRLRAAIEELHGYPM